MVFYGVGLGRVGELCFIQSFWVGSALFSGGVPAAGAASGDCGTRHPRQTGDFPGDDHLSPLRIWRGQGAGAILQHPAVPGGLWAAHHFWNDFWREGDFGQETEDERPGLNANEINTPQPKQLLLFGFR